MFFNQEIVYDMLFRAASEALLTLAKDPKYLNSATGIAVILHSWGQNLMYHLHLCIMVPPEDGMIRSKNGILHSHYNFIIGLKIKLLQQFNVRMPHIIPKKLA